MGFNRTEANKLLVACHRRCCVCHRYCGIKIEMHHIQPTENGGSDSIENAIPLCFECHAKVQLYNDAYPQGRKFRPDELRDHKEQWLQICEKSPGALLMLQRPYDVGPIQALIDELEFNAEISGLTTDDTIGALFLVTQFERSISESLFSLLPDQVRKPISTTYATLMRASSASEVSKESDDLKHGYFTYYLLKGLKGAADVDGDGFIDVNEISSYLNREVPKATGQKQHPVKKGEAEGQVVIGRVR